MKNKKVFSTMIMTIAILGAFALMTGTVYAAGLTQAQINAIVGLLQSFGADQSVINNVQASLSGNVPTSSGGGGTSNAPVFVEISPCLDLQNNLAYRSRDAWTNGEVSALQDFLQSNGYLNSDPTGFFGLLTIKAVQKFQKANGIEMTGYVGPSTRAKIAEVSCGIVYPSPRPNPIPFPIPPSNNLPPVIDGVSGPTSLNVGETGTWSVKAHDPENGNLSYLVNWGDSANTSSAGTNAPTLYAALQTTTFTHRYSSAGAYTVKFIVTDNQGLTAQSTISVQVGNTTQPSITVLSPNGGESWQIGSTQAIKWDSNIVSILPIIVDISLVPYCPPGQVCVTLAPFTIAKSVSGLSYNWNVGSTVGGSAPAGNYTVKICRTNTSDCDSSNSPFTITAPQSASILGRYVFYNNSAFDGNNPAANADDDKAIATDKKVLPSKQTASFSNYTNYSRGINGIMVDILNPAGTVSANDFEFRIGNDNNSLNWATAPSPSTVSIRKGAGMGGSDRITVIWPDNAIQKRWLRVAVLKTITTNLPADDIFYIGNAIGDVGDDSAHARVNLSDVSRINQNPTSKAEIFSPYDINRDGTVDNSDGSAAQANITSVLSALRLITPDVPPVLTIQSPNGGESWSQGSMQQIKWYSTAVLAVGLGLYGPNNWYAVITNNYPISSDPNQVYSWQVPLNTPIGAPIGPGYTIRVLKSDELTVNDFSDSSFTIAASTTSSLTPEAVNAIAEFSQKKNLNLANILAAIEQLIEAFK